MRPFFSQLMASTLGVLIAFMVVGAAVASAFVFFVALFSGIAQPGSRSLTEPSILVIDLNASLEDSPPAVESTDEIMEQIIAGAAPSFYLLETLEALRYATQDDNIRGVLIHGSLIHHNYGSGLPALRELRDALQEFSDSGKLVYAYLNAPEQSDYYLASVADKVWLNPAGTLPLRGIGATMLFLGDTFKQYGVGVQVLRTGKYKSAVEMFTENKMSEPAREQMRAILTPLWAEVKSAIAESRGVAVESLESIAQNTGELLPDDALAAGLVDHVGHLDELFEELETLTGVDTVLNSFRQIALTDYIIECQPTLSIAQATGDYIAVVYAEGEIIHGFGFPNDVSDKRISKTLRQLRNDARCRAVVLRVNSPGGSALASDIIQREMILLKAHKPVVVSMGTYAASGGYWISAYSHRIFADPMTITGSIGVFGLIPNFNEIAQRHGVSFDRMVTAPYADIYSVARPKSETELALLQKTVNHIYDQFIEKVAEGRAMQPEAVESVAQGRVWTGLAASERGLVDTLGGLMDAIDYAAELADLQGDYFLVESPRVKDFDELLAELFEEGQAPEPLIKQGKLRSVLSELPREFDSLHYFLQAWQDPRQTYARLPWVLTIQ